jgi:hypothetical protein
MNEASSYVRFGAQWHPMAPESLPAREPGVMGTAGTARKIDVGPSGLHFAPLRSPVVVLTLKVVCSVSFLPFLKSRSSSYGGGGPLLETPRGAVLHLYGRRPRCPPEAPSPRQETSKAGHPTPRSLDRRWCSSPLDRFSLVPNEVSRARPKLPTEDGHLAPMHSPTLVPECLAFVLRATTPRPSSNPCVSTRAPVPFEPNKSVLARDKGPHATGSKPADCHTLGTGGPPSELPHSDNMVRSCYS